MTRSLLIVNPHAGGGLAAERVDGLVAELSDGERQYEMVLTDSPGHAEQIALGEAANYAGLVAVGGDGTVGEVAAGLLASGADSALAILPLGTGNDAGRGFGIGNWADGVAALRGTLERRVDVISAMYRSDGRDQHRIALVGVGVGYPAELLEWTTERVKRVLGRWSYTYAGVACALCYRCPALRIVADGEPLEGRWLLAAACNAEWTAGHTVRMAPGASVDDGWMDLILVRRAARPRLLAMLTKVADGGYVSLPEVLRRAAREVTIEGDPTRLNLDGDPAGEIPLSLRLVPGALRVRVPLAAQAVSQSARS